MAELTAPRPAEYHSEDIGLNQLAVWTHPTAPNEPLPPNDSFLPEQEFSTTAGEEYFLEPDNQRDLQRILRDSRLRSKLIAGGVVVAVLALSAIAYVYWPAAVEKTDTAKAEIPSTVQSAPVVPVQAVPRNAERAFVEPSAVAWPHLPLSTEAFPKIGEAAQVTHGRPRVVR